MHDVTVLAHAPAAHAAWWSPAATAAGLSLVAAGYAVGLRRLGAARHGRVRALAFAGGLLTVAVALLSPLEAAAETFFSAHMVQHMLLIAVAAPLLAVGAPGLPFLLALPVRWRRWLSRRQHRLRAGVAARAAMLPVAAWLVHLGTLWAWHMPAAYDATLSSEAVHVVEHLTFLGTAWLLWWHVATPGRARISGPVAAMYLFTVLVPSSALGAVLTLARAPLYAEQASRAAEAGADPLADQQVAGLVMWIPADAVYLVAIVGLMFAWLAGRWRSDAAEWLGVQASGPSDRPPIAVPPGEAPR